MTYVVWFWDIACIQLTHHSPILGVPHDYMLYTTNIAEIDNKLIYLYIGDWHCDKQQSDTITTALTKQIVGIL
jgi:hypothetical protein